MTARLPFTPDWETLETSRVLKRAFSINSNSRWTAASVAEHCPEAKLSSVIYYGKAIDAGWDRPAAASPRIPGPFILSVARLAEYKGLDVLVMAFAEIAAVREDLHLVICGADHSSGGLQRFIGSLGLSDRVLCLGQRNRGEVRALMRDCELFALPSRKESLGGVLIEAMQEGKAVVASRVGGIPELIRSGREGLLVQPKDVGALARAVKRLLDDPELRRRMGDAGRERSRVFDWQRAVDDYREVFRAHPRRGSGIGVRGKLGLAFWETPSDATGGAYLGNLTRGLRTRGEDLVVCVWREDWKRPFRCLQEGVVFYRLGLPGRRDLLDAVVMLLQLLYIARSERVTLWHCFIIRYRRLKGLAWFLRLGRHKPVVTLA